MMKIWLKDKSKDTGIRGMIHNARLDVCRYMMLHSACYSRWQRLSLERQVGAKHKKRLA